MKIKPYYCKHCGQFRSPYQVYKSDLGGLYIRNPQCKYCDREVVETVPYFQKWLEVELIKEQEREKSEK